MARISETDAFQRVFLTGVGIFQFAYQAAKRPQAAGAGRSSFAERQFTRNRMHLDGGSDAPRGPT